MEKFNFDELYERRNSSTSLIDEKDIFGRIKPSRTRREIFHAILVAIVVVSSLCSFASLRINYEALHESEKYSNEINGLNKMKEQNSTFHQVSQLIPFKSTKRVDSQRTDKRKQRESTKTKRNMKRISEVGEKRHRKRIPRMRRFHNGRITGLCVNCSRERTVKSIVCCTCHFKRKNISP